VAYQLHSILAKHSKKREAIVDIVKILTREGLMAIKSITIGNFKGIRDKVTIDLKPITLLFGKNSSGKSSIIHALHYAYEIFVRGNLNPNFTELGGREVDLGGFQSFVYGHDTDRTISLRLDMSLADKGLPGYFDPDYLKYSDKFSEFNYLNIFYWNASPSDVSEGWIEVKISWDKRTKKPFVSEYGVGINNRLIAMIKSDGEQGKKWIQYLDFFHPLFLKRKDKIAQAFQASLDTDCDDSRYEDLETRLDELKDLVIEFADKPEIWLHQEVMDHKSYKYLVAAVKKFQTEHKEYKKDYSRALEELLKEDTPVDGDMKKKKAEKVMDLLTKWNKNLNEIYSNFAMCEFLFFCLRLFDLSSIKEDLRIDLGEGDALPDLEHDFGLMLDMPGLRKRRAGNIGNTDWDWYAEAVRSAISQLILGPAKLLKEELIKFHYIGPIRSRIPRDYQPNLFIENEHWADGQAAWDVLHREDERFVKKVDHWLSKRLRSGYGVFRLFYKEIEVFSKELDTSISQEILNRYNISPLKSRVVLYDLENQVEVHPSDIGTGISQVLPIVVAAVYFSKGIVAIEQPELHIHPAFQVELGDLFISQGTEKNLCFLIETHSEHLLLRILRRIRETHDGELPEGLSKFHPDKLAIYFVDKDETGIVASPIRVDKEGDFIDHWPRGFFGERAEELF